MNLQTKTCQNCKNQFIIEDEDFSFYEKIKVPPPTFCPSCRLQRRLIWMKGIEFFKRKCDLCGELKLSMYHPDAPYTVYCDRCWWSDNWDARDYAMEYDPTRNFLEQWNELLHKTPILGLSVDPITSELSPYCNHTGHAKNCYLLFYTDYNEDCSYVFYAAKCKNVIDSAMAGISENCYDCHPIEECFKVFGSGGAYKCVDSAFLFDCQNCTDCFGSTNLHHKSNVFFNEQLSKDEYKQKLSEIDLGSYKNYQHWKQKAEQHFKKYPPRPVYDILSVDSTGSYCGSCKNCKECYSVANAEDSKFLMLIKLGGVKDCYDYTDWGEGAELLYECMTVGGQANAIKFTHESGFAILNVEYSKLSTGGTNHFGCVSIKNQENCILNKQYSKEEFENLREKIKKDMDTNPYISAEGHEYKYGEFFPPEFSPHFYNDTFANRFFPLSKEQTVQKGLRWLESEQKEYAITLQAAELPDHIKDAMDEILKQVISCSTCSRGFKIIASELQFLRQYNLPLPRHCPFCRIWEKVDVWVQNMTLHDRACDKCKVSFRTHYTSERAPVIYCKSCYNKEVR